MTSRLRSLAWLPLAALALSPSLASAVAGAAGTAGAAGIGSLDARIDQVVERITPALVETRHKIHQNPELGNKETATAALVAERLRALGYEVKTGVAKTGVVAILKGGRPGPVVAVRADMDALPVTEQTDFPFRSTKRDTFDGQEVGVAHACGHDIHTTVELGVAEVLAALKADLPGTVKLIFQPAEEGPPPGERGGADVMLEEGALANPKPAAIFALHSFPDIPVGQVGYTEGPTYAAVDEFRIKIHGKQAHGAYPHLGIDPVVTAAQAILALQTIRSRNLSGTEPGVVTVGVVRGGERFNIIPEEVLLAGTVRTYHEETRSMIEKRMREILDGITKAAGATFELDYRKNAPATVNEPALSKASRPALERALGKANVVDAEPTMGGEDFAYFANVVPGFYFRLGTVKPGTTSGGLHTPTFRGDDSAIPVGVRAMSRVVVDYLQTHRP
ncbi:MAG TPA: amidohydrolase [Thermoanaerobaculia bacterium]|nr:amidohydrolase [Thermoanaerobaculia bacterium]